MARDSEKRRATAARWREKNRELVNAYAREWKKNNRDYSQLGGAYTRDLRRNGPCDNRMDLATWRRVRAAFGDRCCYCRAAGPLELEHLTPAVRGGRPVLGNLAPACGDCNRLKMTMTLEEFRPERAARIRAVARLESPTPVNAAGASEKTLHGDRGGRDWIWITPFAAKPMATLVADDPAAR